MTHHIKCVTIFLFLLFLSCSGNTIIERSELSSAVVHESVEEPNNFRFFKSFQFCDNPYAAYTQEEANSVYQGKEINLDEDLKKEAFDWNSFFYEGSLACIEEELGKHTSSYLVATNEESPFDKLVVFNDACVLIAQDGFFFAFDNGKKKFFKGSESIIQGDAQETSPENNLAHIMKALQGHGTLSAPLEYSYDFILEQDGFKAIESELKGLDHLSDFQFAKMQSKDDFNLLLASGVMESGQSEMYLFTLDGDFNVADYLLLYSSRETEDGAITTKFKIDDDHLITISKVEASNKSAKIIEERKSKIDENGYFVKTL